nr:MAG: hypothetical protein DIU80_14385 [Chloroflexota bacterium]
MRDDLHVDDQAAAADGGQLDQRLLAARPAEQPVRPLALGGVEAVDEGLVAERAALHPHLEAVVERPLGGEQQQQGAEKRERGRAPVEH